MTDSLAAIERQLTEQGHAAGWLPPDCVLVFERTQMTDEPTIKPNETAPADRRWTKPETIEREFGYHPATPVTGPVHDRVREILRDAAHELNELLPECPRKTDAINALRQAMWAANSAIACYGHDNQAWQNEMRAAPSRPDGTIKAGFAGIAPTGPEAGEREGHTELDRNPDVTHSHGPHGAHTHTAKAYSGHPQPIENERLY